MPVGSFLLQSGAERLCRFQINRGGQLLKARRGTQTYVGDSLTVLDARRDVENVAIYGAFACSAGILAFDDFARLTTELLGGLAAAAANGVDLVYFALHGAMSAVGEHGPEGYILERARALLGPAVPFVASLGHGIASGQMLRHSPAIVTLKTHPHVDLDDTGGRAARFALYLLGVAPVAARIRVPVLVRGDKLKTETGIYGRFLERRGDRAGTRNSRGCADDRQSLHRRARVVLPGHRRRRRRCRQGERRCPPSGRWLL
jgi:microcystin degradation protein MlrC